MKQLLLQCLCLKKKIAATNYQMETLDRFCWECEPHHKQIISQGVYLTELKISLQLLREA